MNMYHAMIDGMIQIMTAEELRKRRSALGMSQMRLATALGVHVTTVIGWERGRHPMPRYLPLALTELERNQPPARQRPAPLQGGQE